MAGDSSFIEKTDTENFTSGSSWGNRCTRVKWEFSHPPVVRTGAVLNGYTYRQNCSLLNILRPGYHLLFLLPAAEDVMENPVDLIQRLLEIQNGGQQRSPELIAEDERLIERLRSQVGSSTQALELSPDNVSPELSLRQNR